MSNGKNDPSQISFSSFLETSFRFDTNKFKLTPLDHRAIHSTCTSKTSTLTARSTTSTWHASPKICSQAHAYEVYITPELPERYESRFVGGLIYRRTGSGEMEMVLPPTRIVVMREARVTADMVDDMKEEETGP